jgi:hypothetical protein
MKILNIIKVVFNIILFFVAIYLLVNGNSKIAGYLFLMVIVQALISIIKKIFKLNFELTESIFKNKNK